MEVSNALKALTNIQPPCAFPLLAILTQMQEVMQNVLLTLKLLPTEKEKHFYSNVAYQSMMLLMAGFRAGKRGVVYEGHPKRFKALELLADFSMTLVEGQGQRQVPLDTISTIKYFSRLPSMPNPGMDTAKMLFSQAIQELKIGYGSDAEQSRYFDMLLCRMQGRLVQGGIAIVRPDM